MARFIPIIIVVVLVAYSVFWYAVASSLESKIKHYIAPIELVVGAEETVLPDSVEELDDLIEVSGYPFAFHITLHPGRYALVESVSMEQPISEEGEQDPHKMLPVPVRKINDSGPWIEFSGSSFRLFFSFFEENVVVNFPETIFAFTPEVPEGTLVHFAENGGSMELTSRSKNVFFVGDVFFGIGDVSPFEYVMENFTKFVYSDEGTVIYEGYDATLDALMYTSDDSLFSLVLTDIEEYYKTIRLYYSYTNVKVSDAYMTKIVEKARANLNENESLVLDWVVKENARSGSSSATLDLSYTGYINPSVVGENSVFSVNLNQLSYSDHQFSFSSQGKVGIDAIEEGVYGWAVMEVGNYTKLIDYVTRLYNTLMVPLYREELHQAAGVFMPKIPVEHVEISKRLIAQLGRVSGDEKNIVLYAHKNKGSRFVKLGKFSIQKVLRLFKKEVEKLESSSYDN